MKFTKQIWYLFKLDRSDFNRADRKIEKVLSDVFEKGKEAGRKEQKAVIKQFINLKR
jgi:hypothetical protein